MARPFFERARLRRIRAEWEWLGRTAAANPGLVRAPQSPEEAVELPATPFYELSGERGQGLGVRFVFPEYYPSVPVEAYLTRPVLHPNVHPETGFICLWDMRQEGTSLVSAVVQVQKVVAWRLYNYEADHLMQPEAAPMPPLEFEPVVPPREYYLERSASLLPPARRKRLS